MTEGIEQALETIVGGILFCIAVSMLLLLAKGILQGTEQLSISAEQTMLSDRS